jgi:hypothetical protein
VRDSIVDCRPNHRRNLHRQQMPRSHRAHCFQEHTLATSPSCVRSVRTPGSSLEVPTAPHTSLVTPTARQAAGTCFFLTIPDVYFDFTQYTTHGTLAVTSPTLSTTTTSVTLRIPLTAPPELPSLHRNITFIVPTKPHNQITATAQFPSWPRITG